MLSCQCVIYLIFPQIQTSSQAAQRWPSTEFLNAIPISQMQVKVHPRSAENGRSASS